MKTNYKGRVLIYSIFLLLTLLTFSVMVESADDSAAGEVAVGNSTPVVSDVKLVDNTYSEVTNFDPDNTNIFGINATVVDSNLLTDLANITFYLYDASTHDSDFDSASPNGNTLVTFTWNESNDNWALDQGAFTEWTFQTPQDCTGSCDSLTTYDFTARWDASRAFYASTDITLTVRAYDDQGANSGFINITTRQSNNYFELAYNDSTFNWTTVSTGSVNNTIQDGNLSISFYANTNFELRLNATDMTAGGEPNVDLDTVDAVTWDEDGEVGGNSFFIRNSYTVGLGTWDGQTAMASETALTRDCHFWFSDTGDFAADKLYTLSNLWIELRADV
jgi:hypothetical protein